MYNRYLRNDDGSYTRIPEEETPRRPCLRLAERRKPRVYLPRGVNFL